MKICTNCCLPETFPGISFNDEGVCNHCQRFNRFDYISGQNEQRERFRDLLLNLRDTRTPKYDAIVALSGGKDSTLTLKYLVDLGLNVMAFTFENGYISPQAHTNIKTVCDKLRVPSLIIQHDQKMMDTLFRAAAEKEMYSKSHATRASDICTLCSNFFKSAALSIALEENIPLIGYGWSPGQTPLTSCISQVQPKFVKVAQATAKKPVYRVVGWNTAQRYFLQDHHFEIPDELWPFNVHPLAFYANYTEEHAKEVIAELGWVKPTDVDANSTNCTMNAFANQVHINRHGFHPYANEISAMVRQRCITREEGMEKLYTPQDKGLVEYAGKRLDISIRVE